ncbi:MAG TPA: FkbM family methyltransferase [Chitinophagaceae bacterium]|nr:FkbM family methyltransferase [Chitinophagaceae bacterium]
MNFLEKRLRPAFSKFLFCLSASATPASFLKLIANTKLAASGANRTVKAEAAVTYKLIPGKKKRKLHLRTYAGDLLIFYEIFWKRVYDVKLAQARCVIDIGANVGLSTILFSEQFPGATVFSLEPDITNYNLLIKNCREDIDRGRVVAVHAAIYNKDVDLYLERAEYAYNSSVSEKEERGEHVEGISVETLLNKFKITRVDLLKIDIEGAEEKLFASNYDWLSQVDTIIIEVHSPNAKKLFMTAVRNFDFKVVEQDAKGNCQLIVASKL